MQDRNLIWIIYQSALIKKCLPLTLPKAQPLQGRALAFR